MKEMIANLGCSPYSPMRVSAGDKSLRLPQSSYNHG